MRAVKPEAGRTRDPWKLTGIVTVSDDRACFAFLGFEFRWIPSKKTGRCFPCVTPIWSAGCLVPNGS